MNQMLTWITASVRRAGWAPISFFLLHIVISKVFGGYLALPWLDIPMHFFGGVAIAYFFRSGLALKEAAAVLGPLTDMGRAVLGFALVCTSTVIWEFAEWTTDSLGLTESQVNLDDTLLDMLLGVSGGVCLLIALSVMRKGPRRLTGFDEDVVEGRQ